MDQYSRWPEAVPLRILYSKTICETLPRIFVHTRNPRILEADDATHNTSNLSDGFPEQLGVASRFPTPGHAEGNAVVERYTKVIKEMTQRVFRSGTEEGDWIPPLLQWAYREMPHAPTRVSPYELVYGRPACGPLAVLKENLEIAKRIAKERAQTGQRQYVDNYNHRSRGKSFEGGRKVILPMRDLNSKSHSSWTDPRKIRQKAFGYSYDVVARCLHANNSCKYVQNIAVVGVKYEPDEGLKDLERPPSASVVRKKHSKLMTMHDDDVIRDSMTWPEHLRHPDEVPEITKTNGFFKLRLAKCKFARSRMKLLGRIDRIDDRKVDPQKGEALEIQTPTIRKEVRSFLVWLQRYRIHELSRRALWLTETIKRRELEFFWNAANMAGRSCFYFLFSLFRLY